MDQPQEASHQTESSGLVVRYTEPEDVKYLKEWLMEPETICWFPMVDEVEIDDAVVRWIAFSRYKCSLTAVWNGVPCGIATLYYNPTSNWPINVNLGYCGKGFSWKRHWHTVDELHHPFG